MTAIILAGGKSSRFGSDKAFIKINGTPLIERQIRILKKIFSRQAILKEGGIPPKAEKKIIIVTNNPEKYKLRSVKIVSDIIPNRGPLGGIYSGLMYSDSFYNFVVACDMPNLNLKLIKYMIKQRNSFDVVAPHLAGGFETLFAIYSKNCIIPIHRTIVSKNLRIRDFFRKVKVREIKEAEVKRFGKPDILFMNVNTLSDYTEISEKLY